MRIISFIEDREVMKAILKHLGLWLVKSRPTPKAHAPPAGYLRQRSLLSTPHERRSPLL
ncbi:MAG: hypothetical protein ABSH06_18110 [Thermodesulfobacteriota bacterium]